jgi:predicted nucleotidyltransferase
MTRDDVIATLRAHEAELKRQGVTHAALFGSLARGEAGPDSDIDVMVEIDPDAHIGLWGYSAVVLFIQGLFNRKVDVADREGLKAYVRPSAERDAIYAF